jgi:PPP family 3-phenylpropionic acid transporter
VSLSVVLKNRRLVLLLAFGLSHFIFVSCTNTFLSVYYTTGQGMNAGIGMYGLFYAVCIALEALVLLFGANFIGKLSVYWVFLLAPLAGCGRALTIYLAPNQYVMMICAVFHALMFGPLWTRLAPYVRDIVPEEMRATGQALWSIMVSGLGPVVGSLLGGMLVGLVGIHNLFLVTAAASVCIFAVFFFLFRRQRGIDAAEGFFTEG